MPDEIKRAFGHIKADSQLKQKTYEQISKKMQAKRRSIPGRYAVSLASLILLAGIGWIFRFLYTTEAAILDIDVNPGIEFSINHFDRIIGTYAYNEEGRELLENIEVKNKSYQDALSAAVVELSEMGCLPQNSLLTATLITTGGKENDKKLSELQDYIGRLALLKALNVRQDVFSVDDDTKHYSHSQNLSPAKYLAILELQDIDPTASFESCHNESIEDIKNQTRHHQMARGNDDSGDSTQDYDEKAADHDQHSGKDRKKDSRADIADGIGGDRQTDGGIDNSSGQIDHADGNNTQDSEGQSGSTDNADQSSVVQEDSGDDSQGAITPENGGIYTQSSGSPAQEPSTPGRGHHGGGNHMGGRHGMH